MWQVTGELHNVSLRFMRILMQIILLLPTRPHRHQKLIYTIGVIIYLTFVINWRFSFYYNVIYDFANDNFSRFIDLLKCVMLNTGHFVVAIELIWRNRSDQIEQELESMRHILQKQFGQKMNLVRVRRYSNAICGIFVLCVLFLFGMTVCSNQIVNTLEILYYHFYSEVVLFMRLCEFTLHATLIFCFYLELRTAGQNLIQEIEESRFEVWSLRRSTLNRLYTIQQLHGQLWNTVRLIESHFQLSLIIIMLKYFVDTSLMPYWIFISLYNKNHVIIAYYCATEDICKLIALIVPCLICTRCDILQRRFRSVFHSLNSDRRNEKLNCALLRISAQLGQEKCFFTAGGLLSINNDTLGKFICCMVSYIVICIQFRVSLIDKTTADVFGYLTNNVTLNLTK